MQTRTTASTANKAPLKTSNGNGVKSTIMSTDLKEQTVLEEEELSLKEKKFLSHRLKVNQSESEFLLSKLQLVSAKPISWFKCDGTEPIVLRVYSFMDDKQEKPYSNRQSFFALCTYDYRLWRCKNFKEVAFLQKALKKDLVHRYPLMEWA
jgi:hypothetical protein